MAENINHPEHYNIGKIEVIDFIDDQGLGFSLGNAVKYICRAGKKNPEKTTEDLKKAVWYINHFIDNINGNIDAPDYACIINENVYVEDIWVQLAGECSELAQAALKMYRIYTDKNKPRKTLAECQTDVIEEYADIQACFDALMFDEELAVEAFKKAKLRRWAEKVVEGINND